MSRAVTHWRRHWRSTGTGCPVVRGQHWHGLARACARARRRQAFGRYGFRACAARMRSRHRNGASPLRRRACRRNGSPRAASLGTTQSRRSTDGSARRLTRRAVGMARVVAHPERWALSASAEIPASQHPKAGQAHRRNGTPRARHRNGAAHWVCPSAPLAAAFSLSHAVVRRARPQPPSPKLQLVLAPVGRSGCPPHVSADAQEQ